MISVYTHKLENTVSELLNPNKNISTEKCSFIYFNETDVSLMYSGSVICPVITKKFNEGGNS